MAACLKPTGARLLFYSLCLVKRVWHMYLRCSQCTNEYVDCYHINKNELQCFLCKCYLEDPHLFTKCEDYHTHTLLLINAFLGVYFFVLLFGNSALKKYSNIILIKYISYALHTSGPQ